MTAAARLSSPMRILMAPVGSDGDVHPHVAIALALRRRGHDVSIITNPHFAPLLERVGLPCIPVGTVDDYDAITADPHVWHSRRGLGVIGRGVGRHAAEVAHVIREQAATGSPLLVASGLAFGARAAHDALGLPLVTLHLQPACFLSAHEPVVPHLWLGSLHRRPMPVKRFVVATADYLSDRALAPAANALCAQFGLAPVRHIVRAWWHSPQCVIGLFPDWYAASQPDWPPHTTLTGFPLYDAADVASPPPALEAWLDAGDPPIVFVAGSGNRQAARFFQAATDACRHLGRRGLLLTRFTEQVPRSLPSGVRHVTYAPLSWLLPRAAAIAHHGGIGTAAQALRAGCPQLVLPMTFDQPDNALRLERLGVGRALRRGVFSGPAAADALAALLESADISRACRLAARRFDGIDPVTRTCELIEAAT